MTRLLRLLSAGKVVNQAVSEHMHYIESLIFVCVMSGLVLFGALSLFCEAADNKTNRLENPAAGVKRGMAMRVLWTVSAYHIGENAMWGKTEAESMLFKPLDISTSTITFDGKTCNDVTFETEIVDAAKYLAERKPTGSIIFILDKLWA